MPAVRKIKILTDTVLVTLIASVDAYIAAATDIDTMLSIEIKGITLASINAFTATITYQT